MQKHAGILFISKKSSRIFLLLNEGKWIVPTFTRSQSVIEDATPVIKSYYDKESKLIPIELYLSQDQGFEFSTYICLINDDFTASNDETYCWATLTNLPKNLHSGLKATLANKIIQTKINTILLMGKDL
jgi:hypothetical protein